MNTLEATNNFIPNKEAYTSRDWAKCFKDFKGVWKIDHLTYDSFQRGEMRYLIRIELSPSSNKKQEYRHPYGYIYKDQSLTDIKSTIKYLTGYTPSPSTLEAMTLHFRDMLKARIEEDLFYAASDKEPAKRTLEQLKHLILSRYEQNNVIQQETPWNRNIETWKKYTTEEEQKQAIEAQQILNGYSYVDPNTAYHGGHMALFWKDLHKDIQVIEANRRKEKALKERQYLQSLLDLQPKIRRLVSLWKHCRSYYNGNTNEVEVVHRLYGYTKNAEQYYQKFGLFREEYLKPFNIDSWDLPHLSALVQKDDHLPPVPNTFVRKDSWHYGDRMLVDGRVEYVTRVGTKYLHYRGGKRIPIHKAQPLKQVC